MHNMPLRNMGEIMEAPISQQDLDDIVFKVTSDYLEDKAINGVIEDLSEELVQSVVQDVIFIIDTYMTYINEKISEAQAKELIIKP